MIDYSSQRAQYMTDEREIRYGYQRMLTMLEEMDRVECYYEDQKRLCDQTKTRVAESYKDSLNVQGKIIRICLCWFN